MAVKCQMKRVGVISFLRQEYISSPSFLNLGKNPAASQFPSMEGNAAYQTRTRKGYVISIILDQISFIQAFPLLLHINRLSIDKVNERPSAWSTGLGTCRLWDSCRYSATQPGSIPLRYLPEAPSLLKTQVKFQSDTLSQSNIRPFSGKPHGNL